jgi:hypothetical protein
MILDSQNPSPIVWTIEHFSAVGWPTLIYAVWRVTRFFTVVETRVLTAEEHITKMSSNCFPTMQASLQTQDGLMKSMDSSLKTLANGAGGTPRRPRKR